MTANGQPIRVLVVDDSTFLRQVLSRYLEADPGITVVGTACDGLDALAKIPLVRPDVITLDVEMPRMDGLTALKRIMADCPTPVIMVSSLTQQGARPTIQALMRGAVDFVPKPTAGMDMRQVAEELTAKVRAAAGVQPASLPIAEKPEAQPAAKPGSRPFQKGDPVVAIGASTGGPRALETVLTGLPGSLPAAIVVVQHMPPHFTHSLAERLNERCALTVREAQDGDALARGTVLLAPGGFHLQVGVRQVKLDQGPARNHVRPAVDVLMESAVDQHGAAVIGIVLTGMGTDGLEGSRQIRSRGGRVLAEHESTSVVYGMPRSVVEAGLANQVAPLPEVAGVVAEWVNGRG